MMECVRRLLLVLSGFAIVGGTSVQLTQATRFAAATMSADMPCDQMMAMADAGQQAPMGPCKGMTPNCIKLMGCVSIVALPVRLTGADTPISYSRVAYWSGSSVMAGVNTHPEPLPPRTI